PRVLGGTPRLIHVHPAGRRVLRHASIGDAALRPSEGNDGHPAPWDRSVELDVRQSIGRPSPEEQVSMVAATRETGDTAWFSDAVVAILPELYGTARRLTKNAADAEYLVAEAVARAWRACESLS